MMFRTLLNLFLLLGVAAVAQAQLKANGPVTLAELRSILSRAEKSADLIAPTNKELIDAVEARGVDFVLTPEEEWALRLREASDDLIAALRSAFDPAEREFRLRVAKQQDLYNTFVSNFNSSDLSAKTAALNAARDFVADYADDSNVTLIVAYMRRTLPSLERSVQIMQTQADRVEQEHIRNLYRETMRENERRRRETAGQQNANPNAPKTNTNSPTPTPNGAVPAPPPRAQPRPDQRP
jgi:hypothetical protein